MENNTLNPVKLPEDALCKIAECLKVLAHPIRLMMVDLLMQGEYPVNRIAELCGLPPHQTCEHLRLMQSHGLLAGIRRGRSVYYRVAAPGLPDIMACIRKNCGQASD